MLCTTGIDIWLAKAAARGRAYPRIQSAWTTFVWSVPALLAATVSLSLLGELPRVAYFWIGLLVVSLAGVWAPQRLVHWLAPLAAGLAVLSIPAAHLSRFGADALSPAGLNVNAGLCLSAVALLALATRNALKNAARSPERAPASAQLQPE